MILTPKQHGSDGRWTPKYHDSERINIPGANDPNWIRHPSADLCAADITGWLLDQAINGREYCIAAFRAANLAPMDVIQTLRPGTPITMVGYPHGIFDAANNQAVFRRGIAATSPALNYQNRPQFLVDIASFPGSSGSPVLLWDHGPYPEAGNDIRIGFRFYLLGILYGGWEVDFHGNADFQLIPTEVGQLRTMPLHLGCAIRVDDVAELMDEVRRQTMPTNQPT